MNACKLRSKLPKETWEPLVFYLIFHTRLFENLLRLGVCLTEGKLDFRECKRQDCCSAETNWIAWALLHRLTLFLFLILQFHASEMLKQTERIFKSCKTTVGVVWGYLRFITWYNRTNLLVQNLELLRSQGARGGAKKFCLPHRSASWNYPSFHSVMLHNVWFSNLLIFKGNGDKIIKLAVAQAQGLCQWKRKEKVLFTVITSDLKHSTSQTQLGQQH